MVQKINHHPAPGCNRSPLLCIFKICNSWECSVHFFRGPWVHDLGSKEDPKSSIMIRFPDGNRVTKEIPCSSQFLAIVEYVKSEGFDMDKHKIVTNFPRKILTDLDTKQTLKELGLFPKEMVIVQKK